jgi:cytochrome c5
MTGPGFAVLAVLATVLIAIGGFFGIAPTSSPSTARPQLGTTIAPFPAGPGKDVADQACLKCHSTDIVRQQKLSEKQWTASVTKMVGWGAEVPENRKDELVRYLTANFGPANAAFRPVVVQPYRAR